MYERLPSTQEKKTIAILCVLAIFAILCGTLWPFNPIPKNDVAWLPQGNGVQLGPSAVILSDGPVQPSPESSAEKSTTVEILLRPAIVTGYGYILTFYSPDNPDKFVVSQWRDGLLVARDGVNAQGEIKRTKFDVDHAFQAGQLLLLTIVTGPHGTIVYRNAAKAQAFPHFVVSPAELSGQLVLGTPTTTYQPWLGEIQGLAIYSKELTPAEVARHYTGWTADNPSDPPDLDAAITRYDFAEHTGDRIPSDVPAAPSLEIPAHFNPPHKIMLTSAVKEFEPNRYYEYDIFENIVGFAPLGMILFVYFRFTRSRAQSILFATLVGAVLSFTVEVLQFYIPRRMSGTTDIITNTLGAALGAAVARPDWIRAILQATRVLPSVNRPDLPQN